MGDPLKIVIAESGTETPGMFRFVLEGEGFEVLAETDTISDLVAAMAVHRPDVVVVAEQTGLGAIAYVRAVSDAKVLLVSNQGAHAGAADAQVESASVISELGSAIHELCGSPSPAITRSFERPAWIDRVRKDPKTLREILAKSRPSAPTTPSIVELQRRATRITLDPAEDPASTGTATAVEVEERIADVVVLPTAMPAGTRIVLPEPEPQQTRGEAKGRPERSGSVTKLSHPHKS